MKFIDSTCSVLSAAYFLFAFTFQSTEGMQVGIGLMLIALLINRSHNG